MGGRFGVTKGSSGRQVKMKTVRKHRVKVPRNKENTAADLLVSQQKGVVGTSK